MLAQYQRNLSNCMEIKGYMFCPSPQCLINFVTLNVILRFYHFSESNGNMARFGHFREKSLPFGSVK